MGKHLTLGVIQVRLGSTRLPQKAMRSIDGRPLLSYLYERVQYAKQIDKVVIATSDSIENRPIIDYANRNHYFVYAGSENDLIDRLYQTCKQFNATSMVRITGDCPLTDPLIIDQLVDFYHQNESLYDIVTNIHPPTYPDGLDLEVISFAALEKAWSEIKDPFWREWVTSYMSDHPADYRIANITHSEDLSKLRWTVDYEEDFEFVTQIFRKIYPYNKRFSMKDILDLIKKEPALAKINEKYVRNEAYHKAIEELQK